MVAAVFADVDVAEEAGGGYYVGHFGVVGEPVDYGVGLDGEVGLVPGLTAVAGDLDCAGYAGDEVAVADEHSAGVVGLDDHAAAVGTGVGLTELGEVVVVPAFALVVAGGYAEGAGAVEGRIVAGAQGHAVYVAVEGVGAEVGQVEPGVPAVEALVHTVNLDAGPDGAAVAGVNDDVGGAGRADGTVHVDAHVQLVPGLAAVARAEALGPGASEDGVWVGRVNGDRPDLEVAGGRVDAIPAQAVVVAAEQAEAVGAGQDAVRVAGVGGEGANIALGGEWGCESWSRYRRCRS